MSEIFSPEYWEQRYRENNDPWDLKEPAPALLEFLHSGDFTQAKILIPGGGKGHELNWMYTHGYTQVFLLDWSEYSIQALKKLYPGIPENALICENFFKHEEKYDLILEQTFFCALPPEKRNEYARHTAELLNPGGILAGVWFNFPLSEKGPPFGGSMQEYQETLKPWFTSVQIELCYNSIPERQNKEVFIIARK